VHVRDPLLANDSATLDPVIFDAYEAIRKKKNKLYDLIVTMQPTSPLLRTVSLDNAIAMMEKDKSMDTLIAAMNDTHLTWKKEGEKFVPTYQARVNRQYLPQVFRETGGFLITRDTVISPFTRIGKNVHLFELKNGEQIDIDSPEDWNLCEYYLKRKRIVIAVSGYPEIGMGHVYNVLSIANDIMEHDILFMVDKRSQLAFDRIAASNYRVLKQQTNDLADDIRAQTPDVVINDMLDTSAAYIRKLKKTGAAVINFEDLGAGAAYADLVINAMYPEKARKKQHYFGERYFCLKNEFMFTSQKPVSKEVGRVLLTFGGVDPNNYTAKVAGAILDFCRQKNISVDVVAGMGYDKYESLDKFRGIKVHRNVSDISEHIHKADIVFTSAGRTTFEVASLGVPCIVMAQNKRELTHFFCKNANGFLNLGMGTSLSSKKILSTFTRLVSDPGKRRKMSERMRSFDLKHGKERVLQLIAQTINAHKK
jgi:spore coat polysaccharide biosynthesis predicted glycosyltransferase SpsG